MKPIIILEGPDGAGKTTLARQLCKELDAVYIHHSSYPTLRGDQLAAVYHRSLEFALTGTAAVVLDRAWHSEPIYGEVFRTGHDRIKPWRRMLDRCLMSVPHQVVLLSAPMEVMWTTVRQRATDEMAKRREQLELICAGYERQAPSWPGSLMRIYREQQSPEKLTQDVLGELLVSFPGVPSSHNRLRTYGVLGALFGGAYKQVLLVGDIPSHAASTTLPFINHDLGGCSVWLAEHLELTGVGENELLWVNAYGLGDEVAIDLQQVMVDLTDYLGYEPPVVALGAHAAQALDLYRVKHVQVRHPQHARRFNLNDGYALGSTLRGLL